MKIKKNKKTVALATETIVCKNCCEIISDFCDSCGGIMEPGDTIYCDSNGNHFCKKCKKHKGFFNAVDK